MSLLSAETIAHVERLRDRYPHPRSAVLPSLWALQDQVGYLPPEGMAEIAAILKIAPSDVQAVSTFYSMYFDRPAGEHSLVVCVNVSCALRGAEDIAAHVEERLGCASGSTTADGVFSWQTTVECLGACGGAPALQLDHTFHENVTPDGIDAILARARASGAAHGGVRGPSDDLTESHPAGNGGSTPLTSAPSAPPDDAAARTRRAGRGPESSSSTGTKRRPRRPRVDRGDL